MIELWSRSVNGTQRSYDTTHHGCYAVVLAALLLRPYLEGTNITIRTTPDNLKLFLNLADATGMMARWRFCLSEFDFGIIRKPGIENQAADTLSRLQTGGKEYTDIDDEIPIAFFHLI